MVNGMVQWLVMTTFLVFHPFFVSVIDISHNAKDNTAEISVRIFTEDLEQAILQYNKNKINLSAPANKALAEKQLTDYIQKNLHLKINGTAVNFQLIGYEIIKESTWTYFEVANVKTINKLEVDCSVLYDFEKTQINILHVKSRGKEKSFKLDNPKRSASFDFQ